MINTLFTSTFALIAFGTIGFWILLSVISIIFITSIESEHYTLPSILSVLLAITYWKSIIELNLDWKIISGAILAYIICGIGWSIYRWYRYVQKTIVDFKLKHGDSLSVTQKLALKSNLDVAHHKSIITGWIAYWPWSLIWNITGDFFSTIYENIRTLYKKIADNAISKNFKN